MIRIRNVRAAILTGGLLCLAAFAGDEVADANAVLQTSGIRAGLCVHLNCGRPDSPGLTAALAENSALLVHGLAGDDAALARARQAIETRGMAGRAMAEITSLNPLPYLTNLANLVVVEDLDALTAQGLTKEEILRVVAPGGVLCVREGGKWTKTIKPRPQEMDEWTHVHHGPDGNMVSTDMALKFPVGFRWLEGFPINITGFAATRGWVLAGGRLFALGVNEQENVGAAHSQGPNGPRYNQYLSARDAFNGLPLWKINCGVPDDGTAIGWDNGGPLAADGQRVYTVQQDKVIIVDAVTGQITATCATQHPAARLALLEGILVAAGWHTKDRVKGSFVWVPKSNSGCVEAFDAQTGAAKWSVPVLAFAIAAADGVVYCQVQSGFPPAEKQIVALDLQTGKERWRVSHTQLGTEADLQLGVAGAGYVAIAKPTEKKTVMLSATDGHVLWEAKSAMWTPVVNGLMWAASRKYDPITGVDKGPMPSYLIGQGCVAAFIVGRYISSSWGFKEMQAEDRAAKPRSFGFLGARPACIQGWAPANGMLYTAQNNCRCKPGAVYGFVALGPSGDWPLAADFEKARPIEKGPAFGAAEAGAAGANDWPTYRHDGQRCAATSAQLPGNLREIWKVQVARPAEGPLAAAWNGRVTSCLSAPVVAGGLVFAANTESGQVLALDAATGKNVWSVLMGSRIDSPPTIHNGLCLIGCHDGWVYALRAKDGQLTWRTRVAPWERRMAAYGQVESVWPAIGSVLIHDNVLYATAGRTSESDGGVALVALDPATGATLWGKAIAPGPQRPNDLLCWRDGSIGWHYLRYDPKTGERTAPAALLTEQDYGGGKAALQGAILDSTWTVLNNRRGGNTFKVGKLSATMLAWNDTQVVSATGAVARGKTEDEAAPKPADYAWQLRLPKTHQVEAIVLTGNAVLYAGRFRDAKTAKATGFLFVLSLADGKRLAEFIFDAPPALDGLAVAGEKVYLSLQNGMLHCIGQN